MVVVSLYLEYLLERRLVVIGVGLELNRIILQKLEHVRLIQLPELAQTVIAQIGLVDLLYLRVKSVIHKLRTAVALGQILDVQTDKLRAQPEHTGNGLDKIVAELVAKAYRIIDMLVQCNGTLAAPVALVLVYLYFIRFLRRAGARVSAYLNGAVRCKFTVAE